MGSYRVTCHARGTTRLVVRAELDAWLADHAAAAGAEVRFGAEAALCRAADGWELRVADQPIRAALILVASGLGGLSTKLGIAGLPAKRRLIAQEWVQPWVPPLPTVGNVEMHWLRGGYVGLATPAPGRVVVAFSAESPPQPGQSVWQRLRARNPRASIWAALPADAPRRYHALGAAGFPWRPERLGDGNVLLVGDAAGYEEPFSGQGMEQALGSGLCAARAILEGGNVLERYTAAIQRSHRPIQQRLRRLGGLLRSSLLQTLASGPVLLPRSPLAHIVTWAHVSA
jgi:flavin-dependent dehydrogenase